TGGLNPHWARFTGRVNGTFDLDSTRLHRLPDSEEHLNGLIDTVVERSSKLEAGRWAEIETIDAWTVQRISEDGRTTIFAVPASEARDMGLAVRRNLRRILGEEVPLLRAGDSELTALVLLGHYPRLEDEGATIALRGFSPGLYSGVDFLVLVTDGLVKLLISAPSIIGAPVTANPCGRLSRPCAPSNYFLAKRLETSACSLLRILTANTPALARISCVSAVLSTQTSTSIGSSESDVTAFAVIP